MKEVFIKYNPYTLETIVTVNGVAPADNSRLNDELSQDDVRLQDWVEKLPNILVEEYNDKDFSIQFQGTKLDCEDLIEILQESCEQGTIRSCQFKHIPAKETEEKEGLLKKIWERIQSPECPVQSLKESKELQAAFADAQNDVFEICVVAIMSAGKSTLINAMLRTKLMPSKQEACTAIITRIEDNNTTPYTAKVYGDNSDQEPIEILNLLTLSDMERLNDDKRVAEIEVFGDIPFVTEDDTALVLIDTPGPNNARDTGHEARQQELLDKKSKPLILYIMTGEFGTTDDKKVLKDIADRMKTGGKQSKDRFLFVVNKMDGRKKEDGSPENTLQRVKEYLENGHGIYNPNIFPVAALPAMNIRLMQSGELVDVDELDETNTVIRKMNRSLHLEDYTVLPKNLREEVAFELQNSVEKWDGDEIENPYTALVHTGIISLEAAIHQYVRKYAKTAKIRAVADAIMRALTNSENAASNLQDLINNVSSKVSQNESLRKDLIDKINDLQSKKSSAEEARKFENEVNTTLKNVEQESKTIIQKIIAQYQVQIRKSLDSVRGKEIPFDKVDSYKRDLTKAAQNLEKPFREEMEKVIRNNMVSTNKQLVDNYKQKLSNLKDEINVKEIDIDFAKLNSAVLALSNMDFSKEQYRKTKQVEDGRRWVVNTEKKWYKPWTWFQESGWYTTNYKDVNYIEGSVLADKFFAKAESELRKTGNGAREYALGQARKIADDFRVKFAELDKLIDQQLDEIKGYAEDVKSAEAKVAALQVDLKWLENMQKDIEAIVEI